MAGGGLGARSGVAAASGVFAGAEQSRVGAWRAGPFDRRKAEVTVASDTTTLRSISSSVVPIRRKSRRSQVPRRKGTGRRLRPDFHKLSIVIPALNEEESIGTTIQRCLDAREHIRRTGQVKDIEVIVVSDGST